MSDSPTLGAAGLTWFRDLVRREGFLRAVGAVFVCGSELALDYLPSRRRLRYGDIDYDFDHRVNTTWAAPTLRIRLREVFTRGKYQPSEPELFHAILDGLAIDFKRFSFIDLGSGKGRTLFMASDYPFHKVIGAEIIPELHAIAVENLARYKSDRQKCLAISAWLGDARQFPLPPDPMVLYLFNPFPADVLREFLARLQDSLRELPRETYVIYHNLIHDDVFQSAGFLRAVHRAEQYAIYMAGTN